MKRYENEEFRTWNIQVNPNAYYVPDNRSAGANETSAFIGTHYKW